MHEYLTNRIYFYRMETGFSFVSDIPEDRSDWPRCKIIGEEKQPLLTMFSEDIPNN